MLRRQHREADPQLQALFQDLAIQMGLARPVSLVVSENAPSPITLGLLHPLVILPPLDADQEKLIWILRHELAHQAGGHLWCKLLLLLARAVHWFNPLVHQMARQAARDLELACDNRVVAGASPVQRRAYARTLLAALETASASTTSLSTPWQGGSSMMKQRFHNLFPHSPSAGTHVARHCAGSGAVPGRAGVLFLGPQATLLGTTDLKLSTSQYTARPGMLIKTPSSPRPFVSPHRHRRRLGAPTEDDPLADAQPETRGRCADRGQHGSHYQVILPALDPPFLEGTLPQSAVSTDPGQFAQANLEPSARTRPVISPQRIPRLSPSSQTPAWYPCPPAQAAGPKYRPLAAGPRSGSAPRTSPTISPGPDAPWTSPN
ncbi:MAG: M56 family metallopeptidase [Evtepia gabavorous]